MFLDGIDNGQGDLLVHQIQNNQIRFLCLQQGFHFGIGFLGIGHVQQHIQLAFHATIDGSIGYKVSFLLTRQILFVLHGKEDHLMAPGFQSLCQSKIVCLTAAFAVVEFVDQ